MSKSADIFFCVVNGSLLCGMGWLVVTASQLPLPKPGVVATLAPVQRARPVIYHYDASVNVDKKPICGGGGVEDYKPRGPTMLAGEPMRGC
ncbi:MAG: hypothetical protein ACKOEW_06600 [Methylocystis sp.]